MNHNIYMDYNATAPVLAQAKDAVMRALDFVGNPSSVHRMGRLAHRLVEDSRESVRALVNANGEARVVFTSGGTEANAICLLGCGRNRVVASSVEHPAVRNVKENVELISVDKNGIVDASHLEKLLSKNGEDTIVSVMLANNETGVIQPVREIAKIAHKHGALFHCDAVQAAGKIEIDFDDIDADYMSISAHKFGGPKGVGALIAKPAAPLSALVRGGGQENGLRGGTENVPGIAGMAAAAEVSLAKLAVEEKKLLSLRDDLEKQISKIDNQVQIIGADAKRLPNTSFIVMAGVPAETQVAGFDLAGISVSAGSACASGKIKQSPVLAAMGISEIDGSCALRVSLGQENNQEDINKFIVVWDEIRTRALKANEANAKKGNAA